MATTSAQRHRWTYDVFVSFRGDDIRKSFMDHLFQDFEQKGIHVFRDDKYLTLGEKISPNLDKVIEESRFLIVVFSKNYASSSWCLKELVKILECKETEEHKHEVRIIFYDVKPNVVRKQTGSYAEAFAKHENSNRREVAKWKEALSMAANLSGWDLQDMANGFESKFIDSISKEILKVLCREPLHVGENLVGVDAHVNEMNFLRFVGSDKVHMIGICGISGIGKTTLAKAIYNTMYIHFEECIFCEDVAKQQGLTQVQMQLIGKIMKTRVVEISSVSDGIKLIKERMTLKPILLVLDDVDDREQLEALAGSLDWFSPGSFIIFTSKDKQLLKSHRVDDIYDMPVLPVNKALELFSLFAFREKHHAEDFMGLAYQVVKCLQGHPLALKVLGCSLYEKPLSVWKSELERLKTYPNAEIQQKLRPSFNGLDFDQQRIFLDIACSFIGENKDFAASVLNSEDCVEDANIDVLVDKSLITISPHDNSLQMHELIRSMAREIISEESNSPGHRSRLWILSDVHNVLNENKASETVEVLDLLQEESNQKVHIDGKAFAHMKNLRILKICDKKLGKFRHPFDLKLWKDSEMNYSGRLEFLSNKLRLFYWHGCPFKFFPSDFYPENIVAIDLSYSRIKNLWTTPKCFGRLKVMNLSHCHNLKSAPDFTRITNLEKLILEGCVNLVKFHPSFGMLKRLVVLNMRDCKRFRRFPHKVEMDSLEVLILSGCLKVDRLPEFFSTILTLREISIDGTAITELPSFVYSQCNLQVLEFGRHEEKRSRWWISNSQPSWLPSKMQHPQCLVIPSLAALCSLRKLNLSYCNISEVSDSIGGLSCLESLYLDGNNFTSFPTGCLSQLPRLQYLRLFGCKKLEELPELPPTIHFLVANECTSLKEVPSRLLNHCASIPSNTNEILKALGHEPLHVGENLVGVDVHVNEMNLLRFVGSDKVHMIGICGISGIGKTTLAKAIYNSMSVHFEKCSFCEDVQGVAKQQGLTRVQMQLVGKIMKTGVVEISSVSEGIMVIRQRMPTKPILLVLDDVDHRDQLEALAGSHDWFFPGSLIIFTGKDKQLLRSHKVDEIYDMPVRMVNNLIGIESRIGELNSLLGTEETHEVRMVGIYGMGGIGKTTIAQALFRRISYKFEGSSFVKDVRENSKRDICALQEKILKDVLGTHHESLIEDPVDGADMIRARFCRKKVLLVLDDVDDIKQLEFLAATREWFGAGSIIIITTRDEHLLSNTNAKYKPAILLEEQAVELFSMHAFERNSPLKGYEELSNRVIRYTGGLPLALKVLGSFFYGREAGVWESTLDRLEKKPNIEILETLKVSFDGLDAYEKDIFLDIACFFKGHNRELVSRILDNLGFCLETGINVLIEKSLITISKGCIHMHDVLQEMGWEIVRESYPNSRLWQYEEIHDIITSNRKLHAVEAIVSNKSDHKNSGFSADIFENMKNIRLLHICGDFTSCKPTTLPDELRWLGWYQYPFSSLPVANLHKLVGLKIAFGKIEHLWMGYKFMPSLKFIHLEQLSCKSFPDVSGAPNVEMLTLSNCTKLVEVHESLGTLRKLAYLNMSGCWNLKRIPSMIEMESLETVDLSDCIRLKKFPEVSSGMKRLLNINLNGCSSLKIITSSICELMNLKSLHLYDCMQLQKLPTELGRMEKLQELQLGLRDHNMAFQRQPDSINFQTLTTLCCLRKLDLSLRPIENKDFFNNLDAFSSLEELHLSGNSKLVQLPASISRLFHLKHLELNHCQQLQTIQGLPSRIQVLKACDCILLEKIEDLTEEYDWLHKIWLPGCETLLENQENERYLDKMLQRSFLKKCVALDHVLSIVVPGSKIPSWFEEQRHGNQIAFKFPSNSHADILGFAVCGVVQRNRRRGYVQTFGPSEIHFRVGTDRKLICKPEVDYINTNTSASTEKESVWIVYIPFSFFQLHKYDDDDDDFEGEDWLPFVKGNFIISILEPRGGYEKLVRCGAHLIYKQEVEINQLIRSSIPHYYDNSYRLSRLDNSFVYVEKCMNIDLQIPL